MAEIFLGVDGGGTRTRAIAVDGTGRMRGFAETGGSNPQHTPDAKQNAREAIKAVVANAGVTFAEVVRVVAGFAGLDTSEDQLWAEEQTAVPGLTCPRSHVNDAVVARKGALGGRAGIVAIAGTGCIILGVTASGRHVRNYDFHHYARASALSLAYDALFRLLIGEAGKADASFAAQTLAHWRADDLTALCQAASNNFFMEETERNYRYGAMAPLVTAAAQSGAPLAQSVCHQAAEALALGVRLVGTCFAEKQVPVALIGGAARSEYMQYAISQALSDDPNQKFTIEEPAFAPETGAALMALEQHGVALDEKILNAFRSSAR